MVPLHWGRPILLVQQLLSQLSSAENPYALVVIFYMVGRRWNFLFFVCLCYTIIIPVSVLVLYALCLEENGVWAFSIC